MTLKQFAKHIQYSKYNEHIFLKIIFFNNIFLIV